jgi:pimeloyl-ACP methyl ester carboxylesterase
LAILGNSARTPRGSTRWIVTASLAMVATAILGAQPAAPPPQTVAKPKTPELMDASPEHTPTTITGALIEALSDTSSRVTNRRRWGSRHARRRRDQSIAEGVEGRIHGFARKPPSASPSPRCASSRRSWRRSRDDDAQVRESGDRPGCGGDDRAIGACKSDARSGSQVREAFPASCCSGCANGLRRRALAAQVASRLRDRQRAAGAMRPYRVWENRDAKRGDRSICRSSCCRHWNRIGGPTRSSLQGGPGDAPSFNARFYSRAFHDIRKTRDLVLVDLRGTGQSAALTCPELSKPDADGNFDSHLLSVPAVRACRMRWEKIADLRFYTTAIAVDDLEEVRQALGYGPINVYGTSYGTRVAQFYLHKYPNSLRAVVLKGIVPQTMAMPETHARAGEDAWKALVARCQDDANCRRSFPTLDADFRQLLARLDKDAPVLTQSAGGTGPVATIQVTRGLFAEAFRNVLYARKSAQAPQLVRQLLAGDHRRLAFASPGVRCWAETPGGGVLPVGHVHRGHPVSVGRRRYMAAGTSEDYRLQQQRAHARVAARRVSSAHRQPAKSAVPALLISGALDRSRRRRRRRWCDTCRAAVMW